MRFIPAVSPVQIQVPLPGPKDGPWPSFGALFKQGPLGQQGPLVKWLRHRPFTAVTRVRVSYGSPYGGVAQPVEHLLHTQGVTDSSSVVSTKKGPHQTVWSFFAYAGPPGVAAPLCHCAGRSAARGNPSPPPLHYVETCGILKMALRKRQAVGHTTREGVSPMRITIHIGPFTVTVIVKRRNRHPGR